MRPQKGADVGDEWERYIEKEKKSQLDEIIKQENLKPAETEAFMRRAFADGYITETGTGITKIMPAMNPFIKSSGEKKQTVIEKLKAFLQKFLNTTEDTGSLVIPVRPYYMMEEETGNYANAAEGGELYM